MKTLQLLFFCCFVGLFSQERALNQKFPKIKSSITVPVKIPLQEVSNMVNSSLGNLIYEDNSYTDNNNDQFKVKVWKTRPIRLVGGTNENIIIEVPLKIWAEKGIGKFGVYTYQETTFETVMYFSSQITFNTNWSLQTNTKSSGFKWVTKPVLDFGIAEIPVTSMVEKSLKKEQEKFCKIIDEQMAAQLNFQEYAVLAWNQFTQPFNVSEEYNTWLRITPISVSVTPLKFYANEIQTTLGFDIYSETFTGMRPENSAPISKMADFHFIPTLPNDFIIQTTANIPFTEASKIAKQIFLNQEYDLREGKSKIKITDIKVYSEDDRVMIEAETEGAVNGTSYISGVPIYDEPTKKIILTDTHYKLKSKNLLHKTATLLFQNKIAKIIEEDYGIPTQEMEDEAKKGTEKSFNENYNPAMVLSGEVLTLLPEKINVFGGGISAIITMKANISIQFKNTL